MGEYERAITMKGIAVGADGRVYLSVGSETNNCQIKNEDSALSRAFPMS